MVISRLQELRMKIVTPLVTAFLSMVLLLPAHGQDNQPPPAPPPTSTPDESSILQQYDQAIDDVAEKAMRSVVEIEVTGFGKPEEDEDNSDQQQVLERQ